MTMQQNALEKYIKILKNKNTRQQNLLNDLKPKMNKTNNI